MPTPEKKQPRTRPVRRPAAKAPEAQPTAPVEPRQKPRPKAPVQAAKPETPKPQKPKPKPRVRPKAVRPERFVWAYPDEPPFADQARPLLTAPAVDSSGRIYLSSLQRLVALEEENGKAKVVWEYVIGSPVPGPTVVGSDGNIRLHCADGFLHCVTPQGKQAWSPAKVGEPLGFAAPLVDGDGNTWISAYDGGLLKIDPDGRMAATPFFRSRSKFDSAGVIYDRVIYIGCEDGYLFAIRTDGSRGVNLWDHSAEQGYTGWFLNSSPAVTADSVIVVAGRDDNLHGFAANGVQTWTTRLPGQMLGSPVLDAHGHVYVGVSQAKRGEKGRGSLVCVDGNSHKIRWEYAAAGPVESTPVIGDDEIVYFGDNAGVIHAVDARGTAQWTGRVESAVRSAGTIVAPHRLAFGLDNETLVVLDCASTALAPNSWPKIRRSREQSGLV